MCFPPQSSGCHCHIQLLKDSQIHNYCDVLQSSLSFAVNIFKNVALEGNNATQKGAKITNTQKAEL